ncbi:MAG: hypothetical protein HQK75_20030, partial [Candidatus Magnetomorum sp.]|nr:hypothetical protein [Candidatus Magnetomorum sp.]
MKKNNSMKNDFIGRDDPQKIFKSFLFQENNRILNIHSDNQGGIGKTWLLLRFQEICMYEFKNKIFFLPELIDLYDTNYRTPIGIMETIAIKFKENSEYFGAFSKLMTDYYSPSSKNKKELLQKAERIFFEDFSEFCKKKQQRIVLFVDSYEHMRGEESTYLSSWLEKDFFPKFPQNVRLVVAGRNPLSDIDRGKIGIEDIHLEPFKLEEIIEYWKKHFNAADQQSLQSILELSEQQLELFAQLSQGKPILVALFVDWFNRYDADFSSKNILQKLEKRSLSEQTAIFEEA